MKFIKGLASVVLATLVLANATIANAATWAYSNLNASDTVVAYSADYPAQTAAAAYWNSLAGTTVVAVTNNQADATVTIEKKDTPAGDADPNVALTYAPNGITDIYPSRVATQGVDLQTVITHELGHSLGLDHDAGSTLMAPAGGQLGGQAHDYQALKADLASHGR
ncbi:matrixin family metalloprotease [Weissella confusa]|uniref:matrixin family metalloprotease n=1 Tax=Weissella confusa TaxID=1583 RepID=UPI0035A3078B